MRTPTIIINTPKCLYCGESGAVKVPIEGWNSYANGESIQQALYDVNEDEREMILTGTHPTCWDEIWSDMEEDESWDDEEGVTL